jgi:hypothetical protein
MIVMRLSVTAQRVDIWYSGDKIAGDALRNNGLRELVTAKRF